MKREEIANIVEESINISKEFNEWLELIADRYKWDKDDVQALIKQLLMCEVQAVESEE